MLGLSTADLVGYGLLCLIIGVPALIILRAITAPDGRQARDNAAGQLTDLDGLPGTAPGSSPAVRSFHEDDV